MIDETEYSDALVQIELSKSQEDFVKQAVREGRFFSESEVVNLSLRLLQAHDRKLAGLRNKIQESLKDTREVSDEGMDEAVERKSLELLSQGIPFVKRAKLAPSAASK